MLNRFTLAILFTFVAMVVSSQQNAHTQQKTITKTAVELPTATKDTTKKIAPAFVSQHLVSGYFGFGLSTLQFNPTFGSNKAGYDFNLGADYIFYFHKHWGISAGINFSRYNSQFVANTSTQWGAVDSDKESFLLNALWNNSTEQHKASTLGIPILALYRHPINTKWTAQYGLGFKTAYITSSSAAPSSGSVTLSGNYPRLGVTFENIPLQGFTNQQFSNSTSFQSTINLSLLASVGASYTINPAWALFANLSADYGLTNLATASSNELITYQSATNTPIYNTVPQSNTISSEKTLALGVKIGATYNFDGAKAMRKAEQDEAAVLAALKALRDKAIADSITNAQRLAEELRQQELKRLAAALAEANRLRQDSIELARLKFMQDSISALKSKGEGKMVVDVRTNKLLPWERQILMLPVEFKLGSALMTPESASNAMLIGKMLAQHPDLKIAITGHTCDLGPNEANYRLGLKRATAIANCFEKAGKEPSNMTQASMGETQPAVPNTSEENRKKNRRVVVLIEDVVETIQSK